MKFLVKILIIVSFLIILVECFSDVIVNNSKLNLTVYNELLRKTNSTLNSIRNIFKNNTSSAKTKKNLVTNHSLYQNIRPKPNTASKDYLITKYNVMQGSVVTPSSVIKLNGGAYKSDYNQNNISEMTQADLLNFLNISNPPITSTDSILYEQSIEVPQISAYEITNSPNHHPSNAVSPYIIHTPHQYYDFLNYPPPIDEQFMTTQKPPFNQIKPTTISPIFSTTRTTSQHFNGDEEPPLRHHKPTTSTPVFIFTYPKNHKNTVKKRQQKRRKKPELMGSSVVAAVQDTLENVYNYFEDMFTDTVQYTTHEELKESHKHNSKKKKRKKIHKPQETKKPFVYAARFPISYASSDEYDSSGTSDSSSSSLQETDSDSASSEEYRQRTFKASPPTKPSITFKKTKITNPNTNQFLKKFKPTPNPNTNLKKLNTKRITVRSLNTQTNKQFTTPVSARRKTTRKPSIGTSKGLVTHVHVTNEFVESTTAINSELSKAKIKKIYDSNESSADYYDDYFNFDEFDDDDDDDDNDDEADISPQTTSKQKIKKSQKKNTKRKTKGSGENYYEYDSMFAIPPISNMLPSLSIFNNDETSGEVQGRSTTPNNVYSGSKFPHITANKYQHEINKNSNPLIWYSPMFGYGAEETTTTTEAADLLPSVTSESSYWLQSWFGSSNEITTENPTTTTESSNNGKWWFPWLADDEDEEDSDKITTTTTTQATTTTAKSTTTNRPLFVIPNPMPNAGSFITFLTEKINPKPTKAAALENPNKKMHYHQYQLWRLLPQSTADVATLEEYRMSFDDSTEVQWWKGPALRSTTEILVSPNMTDRVKEFLDDEYIKFEIIMRDVQPAILYENPKMSNHEKIQIEIQQGHPLTWHRYHSYDDIIKFIEYLHRRHPDNVELIHMGQSYEGRPLIVVKVHFDEMILENSKKSSKTKKKFLKEKFKKVKKKAVFIECGAHGREWMSPAVGTWILNNLMQLILQNNTNGETVRSVDWYILPIMNPDGYQFSFEFDRFWRKTRSNHKTNSFNLMTSALNWMKSDRTQKTCYGVDPSRNWNVDWGVKGASHSKCSEFYMGPEPDSEPEIKALSKFLMDYRKKIKLFLSLHSYGQLISYPTMSNSTYSVNEIHDVHDMVLIAIESLRNSDSGTRYKVDTTNDMMSTRSGTSESYAMHEAGIKYSYIMELRDTGHHGLLLPASYIESSAKTAFGMIKAMVDYL